MDRNANSQRPHTPYLHRRVYMAMLGMALIYVAAVWYGFAGASYVDFLLVVVTAFIVMVVTLPLLAFRQWRTHPTRGPHHEPLPSYHDWAQDDVDTFSGPTSGRSAAIEILLPLGAVAFGMLAFAILVHVMS